MISWFKILMYHSWCIKTPNNVFKTCHSAYEELQRFGTFTNHFVHGKQLGQLSCLKNNKD